MNPIPVRNFSLLLSAAAGVSLAVAVAPAHAVEPGASFEVSWEQIEIPGVTFGVIKNTFAAGGGTVSRIENDDGEFGDGRRVDFAFGGPAFLIGGQKLNIGIKGFDSWRDPNSSSQKCTTAALGTTTFCTVMPLFDPNPNGPFQVLGLPGPGFNTVFDSPDETITYTTTRDVDHWGSALEIEMPVIGSGGAPGLSLSLKGGPAYRLLDSDMAFIATGIRQPGNVPSGVVTYNEKLDTDYWGGFIGAVGKIHIGGGLALVADGEFGVYRASTDYRGAYTGSGSIESGLNGANFSQSLALNREETAYISALKVMLEQDFGPFRFGAFARGEYYSYAPRMNYNDNDLMVGAPVAGLVGPNKGTSIGDDDAWTFSAGGRITFDMNQP
jgi:hypothetical protein